MPTRSAPSRRPLLAAPLLVLLFLPAHSLAIDFTFSYTDDDGIGFFHPTEGDQRRAALQRAGDIIGSLIRPTYIGETVHVTVSSNPLEPGSNTLASASASYFYGNFGSADPRYQADTHYPKALASHLAGHDVQPTHEDVGISVNTNFDFYWGTDGNPAADRHDFVTVAMHEILHGLGFASTFREDAGFGVYGDGTYIGGGLSGLPTPFDRMLTLGPGGTTIIDIDDDDTRTGTITSNNVFFNGVNARNGNAGAHPRIFSPDPWDGGSSMSHLDTDTFPGDTMLPSIGDGEVRQVLSSVVRGALRDLGWNISIATSTVDWTYAGPGNLASTNSNWSQVPMPGDRIRFDGTDAGNADVKMDAQLYQFDEIEFRPGTVAHTLRLRSYTDNDLTGAGIVNSPVNPRHTFILETYRDDINEAQSVSDAYRGRAATVSFRNGSSAGNTNFEVHAGFTEIHTAPNVPPSYNRYGGASVYFFNSATAAAAAFTIQGASGDGAHTTYAHVDFHNQSTAGSATFTTQPGRIGPGLTGSGQAITTAGFGGRLNFHDTANAGTATITNQGQDNAPSASGTAGMTTFTGNSSASSATFNNLPATHYLGQGGLTQFVDNATAASATFNNTGTGPGGGGPGTTSFSGNASAGTATFNNLGGSGNFTPGGLTSFRQFSTAGAATIHNLPTAPGTAGFAGSTEFRDDSNAGTATINNPASPRNGFINFHDRASAANATINLPTPATGSGGATNPITFRNNSSAGNATFQINTSVGGATSFFHSSTAGNATFNVADWSGHAIVFHDSSTTGTATFNLGHGASVQFTASSSPGPTAFTVRPHATVSFSGSFNTAGLATASAGSATFHLLGATNSQSAPFGANVNFGHWSTAGNATFQVDGAAHANGRPATVSMEYSAHAGGSATFHLNASPFPGAPGGQLFMRFGASAPGARVITQPGTTVDVSLNRGTGYGPASIGSLTGPATVNLEGATLILGALNLDDTLTGNVVDLSPSFTGHLTKTGSGTLTLAGSNSYKGTTTVSQGTLRLSGSQSPPTPYVVSPGGALEVLTPRTIASLSSQGSVTLVSTLTLAPNSAPSTLSALAFSNPAAALDLTNNVLTLAATASAAVRQYILDARLTSSTPDPNDLLSLGYAPAPTAGDLLVKLTYTGDANLDGSVNPDDYLLLDRGLALALTDWRDGDFDYSGSVTSADYLLIDRTFVLQGAPLSPEFLADREARFGSEYVSTLLAAVPEPSALSSILYLLPSLLLPRRSHRR